MKEKKNYHVTVRNSMYYSNKHSGRTRASKQHFNFKTTGQTEPHLHWHSLQQSFKPDVRHGCPTC